MESSAPAEGQATAAPLDHGIDREINREIDREIDREKVLHIARLARLTLRDEEVGRVTEQLVKILEHVALLQGVDTTGIEPTAQVGVASLPLRPDQPQPVLARDVVLSQAPNTAGNGFVVPAFVDE